MSIQHPPSRRCAITGPHASADCGEFMSAMDVREFWRHFRHVLPDLKCATIHGAALAMAMEIVRLRESTRTAEPHQFNPLVQLPGEYEAGIIIREAVDHDADKGRFYLTCSVGELAQRICAAPCTGPCPNPNCVDGMVAPAVACSICFGGRDA